MKQNKERLMAWEERRKIKAMASNLWNQVCIRMEGRSEQTALEYQLTSTVNQMMGSADLIFINKVIEIHGKEISIKTDPNTYNVILGNGEEYAE